jgi:RNA polymerase sigma-70 factor (ECF subfamily)
MSTEKKALFMRLYEPVHSRFERFCKARVYGEMDYKDLMHDTVVIAFEKFNPKVEPSTFLFFLFGISIRILSNNKRRADKRSTHINSLKIADFTHRPEQQEDIAHLYHALNALPEIQKETIILFEIVGYSIKEIAALHSSSENAVKQRLHRGRMELKRILSPLVEHQNTLKL